MLHNIDSCEHLLDTDNWLSIGSFSGCKPAIAAAKEKYPSMKNDIDGCKHCCTPCHNE